MALRSLLLAACAGLAALSAPLAASAQSYGYDYGSSYGQRSDFLGGSRLSRCGRNALIGAGVGAVAGVLLGRENGRLGNAALGGIVGGAGTYLACRYLGSGDRGYISNAYGQSLIANAPFQGNFASDGFGAPAVLHVAQPVAAGGDCRLLNAFIQLPDGETQMLPQERYCRSANGQWLAAG